MGIFLSSIVLGAIIGKCFFKKKFWENRYMVLIIIMGIAFVGTLTTNYVVRANTPIIAEVVSEKELDVFFLNDSMYVNDLPLVFDDNWSFKKDSDNPYQSLKAKFVFHIDSVSGDTVKTQRKSANLMFYDMEETDGLWKIGHINNGRTYMYWEDTYIIPNDNDTIPATFMKITQRHDRSAMNSKWVTPFSIPRIKQIKVFAIPPTQYAAIPDSLIRELPFKLKI